MKKVLIITYYWPPAGGPGTLRLLKLAKYLPQFGWQPIILTVDKGSWSYNDLSLAHEIPEVCLVYKSKNKEPVSAYKSFVGMKKEEAIPMAVINEKRKNWKKKIATWVRLNFFIPDAKIGWKPAAVKMGLQIIKEHKPDIIFSSAPPPTVHLIAQSLAKKTGIKWVADFRDPWTNVFYYESVKRSQWATQWDKRLEKNVLKDCDEIIMASLNMHKSLAIPATKHPHAIVNGYDPDDIPKKSTDASSTFTIAYAGKLHANSTTDSFWAAVSQLIKEFPEAKSALQLEFMGSVVDEVKSTIESLQLGENCIYHGYLDHKLCLVQLSKADVLLLLMPNTRLNKSIIPSKLFEYLGLEKYILGIGPTDSDINKIITETKAGKTYDYGDHEGIYNGLLDQYRAWRKGIVFQSDREKVQQYNRKNQVGQIVRIFDGLD